MNDIDISTIQPTGVRILLKVKEVETTTSSGLEISDTATNSAPVMGDIISVGPNSVFKKGQTVMFRRYSVDLLKIVGPTGEQEFFFLEDNDVLATIGGEPTEQYTQIKLRKEGKDGVVETVTNVKPNDNE